MRRGAANVGCGGSEDFGGSIFGKTGVRLAGLRAFEDESRNGLAVGNPAGIDGVEDGGKAGVESIREGGVEIR